VSNLVHDQNLITQKYIYTPLQPPRSDVDYPVRGYNLLGRLDRSSTQAMDGGHDVFDGNEGAAQGQGPEQFGPAVRMTTGLFAGKWIR
jgi:hypothetical protein